MHSKVRFGILVYLLMKNKNLAEAVVSYSVLMCKVLEGKYVSDSGLVKLYILDVACYH